MYLYFTGLALLLVRIVLSIVFFNSVRNKLRDIKGFAKNNDLPIAAAWLLIVAESTVVVSLLPGLLPRVGGLAAVAAMTGSLSFHIFKWRSPYWASKGGWEYDLMILAMGLVIATVGGGIFSLYAEPLEWLLAIGWF